MVFVYMQAPTLLGIGRITVKLELPATGGLYRSANVTYRGVQVGKVTAVALTADGAEATLSLGTSPKIPADLQAEVRSVSAVGEQYVDLRPRTDSPPYLQRRLGDRRAATRRFRSRSGRCSIRSVRWSTASPRTSSANCSTSRSRPSTAPVTISGHCSTRRHKSADYLNGVADRTRTSSTTAGRCWIRKHRPPTRSGRGRAAWPGSPASSPTTTRRCAPAAKRPRAAQRSRPGCSNRSSRRCRCCWPTSPPSARSASPTTRRWSSCWCCCRRLVAVDASRSGPVNNPTGMPMGDFALTVDDPPICTVGFLPPSANGDPRPTPPTIDTPDGLYCKLPQDSPIAVRGARNYPVHGPPRKARAHRRDLRQRQAVQAAGDAPACARPLPDRSEPDRAGHPAGRPGHLQRQDLRPGRGDAAAAGRGPARDTAGAAGRIWTAGTGIRCTAAALIGTLWRPCRQCRPNFRP